jgi:DNA phosphorothioation-associated putative methyltransferase
MTSKHSSATCPLPNPRLATFFAAGDPDEVELAVEELKFGVYDPDEKQLTFHRSLLPKLPPALRVYVHCAALRYGNPEEADLIKIHVRSGKLTFLHYDNFDGKKHPVLQTRIKINLRTRFVQVFDHRSEAQSLPDKRIFFSQRGNRSLPETVES